MAGPFNTGAMRPALLVLVPRPARAYRQNMTADKALTCAMCGDPIEADQARMTSDDGRVAHSGCVYADSDVAGRDHWMPAEI